MADTIKCPSCGQQYPHKPELAGKQVKCKRCGHVFRIASAPGPAPAAEPSGELKLMAQEPEPTPPQPSGEPQEAAPTGPASIFQPPQPAPPPKGMTREERSNLIGAAIFAFAAALAFLLPFVGLQFEILIHIGKYMPIVAGLVGLVGAWLGFHAFPRSLWKACLASGGIVVVLFALWLASPPYYSDGCASAEWQAFECAEGNFAVELPGETRRMPDPGLRHAVRHGMANDHAGYSVTYARLLGPRRTPKAVLDQAQAEAYGPPMRVLERRDITLEGGHPGRAIVAEHPTKKILFVWRVYIVDDTMYQTLVATSPARRGAEDIARFHDSLRLLEPVKVAKRPAPRPKTKRPRPKPKTKPKPPPPRPEPGPPKPEPKHEPPPDADAVTRALFYLKSDTPGARGTGADLLATTTPVAARRAEVAAALKPLLSSDNEPDVRSALRALARWHTPDSVPAIIGCTKHSSHAVRWAALDALGQMKDERAVAAVADMLATDPMRAARVLESMGAAAEAAVLKHLGHQDEAVRAAACEVLGEIGSADSLERMAALLGDQSPRVRMAARAALSEKGQEAEDAVLKQLKSKHKQTVVEACGLLMRIGTSKSLPEIRRLARSRNLEVRHAARAAGHMITHRQ